MNMAPYGHRITIWNQNGKIRHVYTFYGSLDWSQVTSDIDAMGECTQPSWKPTTNVWQVFALHSVELYGAEKTFGENKKLHKLSGNIRTGVSALAPAAYGWKLEIFDEKGQVTEEMTYSKD